MAETEERLAAKQTQLAHLLVGESKVKRMTEPNWEARKHMVGMRIDQPSPIQNMD